MTMPRGPRLTDKDIKEIHYLATEGCPCCKVPLPLNMIAAAYYTSNSTVSRIARDVYKHTDDEEIGTPKEKVELRKRVVAEAAAS